MDWIYVQKKYRKDSHLISSTIWLFITPRASSISCFVISSSRSVRISSLLGCKMKERLSHPWRRRRAPSRSGITLDRTLSTWLRGTTAWSRCSRWWLSTKKRRWVQLMMKTVAEQNHSNKQIRHFLNYKRNLILARGNFPFPILHLCKTKLDWHIHICCISCQSQIFLVPENLPKPPKGQ